MYSFKNDYSEGAHPRILQALAQTNLEQMEGYGNDACSQQAVALLRQKIGREDADIHFMSGGTQTNLTALAAFLRPHEAAIAAHTGHILVHETGAIEATGHKIIAVPSQDGKITAQQVQAVVAGHADEHMVKPRLVYISNPTEIGSIYNKAELQALWQVCQSRNLLLYLDGARLGSALCARGNDLDLPALAELVDAFYIGGTKNGALLGEALVICKRALQEEFRFHMKQKGALLAKGRILGIQFLELFRDDLYYDLARHANRLADVLREEIGQAGYSFLTPSPSNQLFPIFPKGIIAQLQEKYAFYVWEEMDDQHAAIRLVTSWTTLESAVAAFVADLKAGRGFTA